MLLQLLLWGEELCLRVDLERQRVDGVPLVAAAIPILPPQLAEGVKVRAAVHDPPRTARTRKVMVLSPPLATPAPKYTARASAGLPALVVAAQ